MYCTSTYQGWKWVGAKENRRMQRDAGKVKRGDDSLQSTTMYEKAEAGEENDDEEKGMRIWYIFFS